MSFYHPEISGGIPAQAITEVQDHAAQWIIDLDPGYRSRWSAEQLVFEALEDGTHAVAAQWGNIDPKELWHAVFPVTR